MEIIHSAIRMNTRQINAENKSQILNSFHILGQRVDALEWDSLLETLCRWGRERQSCGVCICNVHSLVTALNSPAHTEALARSDINTPDGMPLVWVLRKNGFPRQRRIAGPDLMNKLCRRAAESGLPVFFLGSTLATLNKLLAKLHDDLPNLKVAGTFSPPFKSLTPEEDQRIVKMINSSGAAIVFVGMGCPKQEAWITEHRGQVNAVMIGVGAAFDFHAGTVPRAPQWMQKHGIEWLYRLLKEPRRMWWRYAKTNSIFVWMVVKTWIKDYRLRIKSRIKEEQD